MSNCVIGVQDAAHATCCRRTHLTQIRRALSRPSGWWRHSWSWRRKWRRCFRLAPKEQWEGGWRSGQVGWMDDSTSQTEERQVKPEKTQQEAQGSTKGFKCIRWSDCSSRTAHLSHWGLSWRKFGPWRGSRWRWWWSRTDWGWSGGMHWGRRSWRETFI